MYGNRTTWLKEAASAGNQLVVSVNLVKAALPSWLSSYSVIPFPFYSHQVKCLLSQFPFDQRSSCVQTGQLLTTVNREEVPEPGGSADPWVPEETQSTGSQSEIPGGQHQRPATSVPRELVRSIELLTQNLGVGPAFRVLRSLFKGFKKHL